MSKRIRRTQKLFEKDSHVYHVYHIILFNSYRPLFLNIGIGLFLFRLGQEQKQKYLNSETEIRKRMICWVTKRIKL